MSNCQTNVTEKITMEPLGKVQPIARFCMNSLILYG
jgi:hypothetical protein